MTTTHLFNGMTGVDHRSPGVAVAALTRDAAWVELIADGHHVHPALWAIIERTKPADRLMLISDAIPLAGMGDGRLTISGLDIEVRDGRCTLADGSGTLAGSVIALDTAVRNVVANGTSLPAAVAAASRNPLGDARDRRPRTARAGSAGGPRRARRRPRGAAGDARRSVEMIRMARRRERRAGLGSPDRTRTKSLVEAPPPLD